MIVARHLMGKPLFPVVFTDLDGTLLDHETYSFGPAEGALRLLAERGIPVVICSSKTRAEIEALQREMALDHPFASENGGALFVPRGYFRNPLRCRRRDARHEIYEFGERYPRIVAALHECARSVGARVVGFADRSVDEVAAACGLTAAQAKLAKRRDYDEPFTVVEGGPGARAGLFTSLRAAGLCCTTGGRFDHVTSAPGKGAAVRVARELYARATGCPVLGIGLGDGMNDVSMFREVDIPVLVGSRSAPAVAQLLGRIPAARMTARRGPEGWAEAICAIVGEFKQAAPSKRGRACDGDGGGVGDGPRRVRASC
jgi:mannosyl-3-phosphoglycerate phosphatase